MFGNLPLILPFGILPLLLFIAYVVFIRASESSDKHIGSKTRKGTTEFPQEISALWTGNRAEELTFTSDGRAVSFTMKPIFQEHLATPEAVKEGLEQAFNDLRNHKSYTPFEGWLEHCNVLNTQKIADTDHYRITLSLNDDLVKSEAYIAHEISNLGRVRMSNSTTNGARYLGSRPKDNQCARDVDGRLLITIPRRQHVQGFLDSDKEITMSKNQITRNIQNRLWGRVDVHCLSIDANYYYGAIVVE